MVLAMRPWEKCEGYEHALKCFVAYDRVSDWRSLAYVVADQRIGDPK